ncbi:MAG: hypothetical protein KAI17_14390, partial [Thiotrichaceae bacterium]|nr:hypothetical protein [Thiotrichaceae bacterium]
NSIFFRAKPRLYAPGLPSGLIIYAAVLAHTAQGDVVSNIAKFMPFGGTVTYPETGDVLMTINDTGGLGNFSIIGTRNMDGSMASISQLSGNDGYGAYTLNISNDKLVSFIKNGLMTTFIYNNDGSVSLSTSVARSALYRSNDAINCDMDRNKYSSTLYHSGNDQFSSVVLDKAEKQGFPVGLYIFLIGHFKHIISEVRNSAVPGFDSNDIREFATSKTAGYIWILNASLYGIVDEMLDEYDQQCKEENTSVPDILITTRDGSVITIDTSCPVPAGAKAWDFCGEVTGTNEKFKSIYYILDGHSVGPKLKYDSCDASTQNLLYRKCYDIEGDNHGWYIEYETSGLMKTATHYEHGVRDGHKYDFNSDGIVKTDWWFKDGKNTGYISYEEDGRIQTCDYSASPQCTWDLSGFNK